MVVGGSDHLPIWIDFNKQRKNIRDIKDRWSERFYFEDYWSLYDDCKRLIEISWCETSALNGNNPISIFLHKVESLKEALNAWSKEKICKRNKMLVALQNQYTNLINAPLNSIDCEAIRKVEIEIDNILRDEEIQWRQRLRAV